MAKTINKISDDIIEVVDVVTKTTTEVRQYNKKGLEAEKKSLLERVTEIDSLLKEFI